MKVGDARGADASSVDEVGGLGIADEVGGLGVVAEVGGLGVVVVAEVGGGGGGGGEAATTGCFGGSSSSCFGGLMLHRGFDELLAAPLSGLGTIHMPPGGWMRRPSGPSGIHALLQVPFGLLSHFILLVERG